MIAKVKFCGHDGWFVADIYPVADAIVVRANCPVSPDNIVRPAKGATHHLVDYPYSGFWRPDLGVFVVPKKQFTPISNPKPRIRSGLKSKL